MSDFLELESLDTTNMSDKCYMDMWREDMSCTLVSCAFSFKSKVAHLFIANNGCSDMGAAVRFCESVMPNVIQIQTHNMSGPDVIYDRSSGRWLAH